MLPVLLTAGATRNRVDAIRYLSAHATGATVLALAAFLPPPARLLGSAEACLRARGLLPCEEFLGTRDLETRVGSWCRAHPAGVLVHSAAVGDYEAVGAEGKIPSGQPEVTLRLVPAPKILDQVRGWSPGLAVVSFKAAPPGTAPDALEAIARAQLRRTGSDLVFANALGALADVLLVGPSETERLSRREAVPALAAWISARR